MKIAQIDAFSARPLRGNGAAVVCLDAPLGALPLQQLAAECSQSETAFLLRQQNHWLLRWFTPTTEVALCGHGTLAAARALACWGELADGHTLRLHTRSGPLAVERHDPTFGVQLPTGQLQAAAVDPALAVLLGATPRRCWTSSLAYEVVLMDDRFPLATMAIDQEQLARRPCSGLVVMQAADGTAAADYQLRFFAPRLGIPEDPVTGSAHALVAPYWFAATGRSTLRAEQWSARGGALTLTRAGAQQVVLDGETALVWDGTVHACFPPAQDGGWQALWP